MTVPRYDPITIARQFLYVREIPGNHGLRVNGLQRWSGGADGQPWCAYFVSFVLDVAYQGKSPIARTGSCDELRDFCVHNGWMVKDPMPGDLYFRVRNGTDAHHVGFVVGMPHDGMLPQISGNTNDSGSDNGDGVYEKAILTTADLQYARIPR